MKNKNQSPGGRSLWGQMVPGAWVPPGAGGRGAVCQERGGDCLLYDVRLRLGVNHYQDNHYQWPPLPYDTHYQCQSLPDDNYYHWRPLPTTTTKFHLAKKSLPATTTTWQQLPYDDQYHMTTITIWLPPPYYQNYYISFNHMLFAKMYVWKLKLLNFSLVLRNIKIWPDGIKYICNGELLYTYFLWRLNLTLPQLTEHQASIE